MTATLATSSTQSQSGTLWIWFIPIVMLGLLFLFNRRRQQQTQQAQRSLEIGDQVSTTSGLLGELVELDDKTGTIEAAPGVRLRFDRRAIVPATLTAGTAQTPSESSAADEHPSVETSGTETPGTETPAAEGSGPGSATTDTDKKA